MENITRVYHLLTNGVCSNRDGRCRVQQERMAYQEASKMRHQASSVFTQIDAESETQARSGSDHIILKANVINGFQDEGLNVDEIFRILGVGSKEQIVRTLKDGGNLTPEQSEIAFRIAHIVSLAERVFRDRKKAFLWLRLPNAMLGNKQPLESLSKESGARFVEEALMQIEYGVYG